MDQNSSQYTNKRREDRKTEVGAEHEGEKVAKARGCFCQLAVAEAARYPGVTSSSVIRLAVSDEIPDLKKYLKMF